MKSKVLLLALAAMLAGGAMAQDCTFFFPTTKGTKLVKKSYDGKGNLSGVMTYVVDEVHIVIRIKAQPSIMSYPYRPKVQRPDNRKHRKQKTKKIYLYR